MAIKSAFAISPSWFSIILLVHLANLSPLDVTTIVNCLGPHWSALKCGKSQTGWIWILWVISFNQPPPRVTAFCVSQTFCSPDNSALSSLWQSCLGSYHKLLLKLHIIRWHRESCLSSSAAAGTSIKIRFCQPRRYQQSVDLGWICHWKQVTHFGDGMKNILVLLSQKIISEHHF